MDTSVQTSTRVAALPGAPRVLVVEDDDDLRDLFVSHLRRIGCDVVDVSCAEEALLVTHSFQPRVAVVDLKLPGMSGAELIEVLRVDPVTEQCRIVVTSVLDVDLYPPADAVLPKPFTRRQVERVVTGVLSGGACR